MGPPVLIESTESPRAGSERRPLFAADAAGDAAPTGAAPLTQPVTSGSDLLAMGLPLTVVVGLILISAAVLRRVAKSGGGLSAALTAGGSAPAGLLEVLGRYPVARGQSLVLLKVDRRVLLLAHTQGGRLQGPAFSTLCEIADPDEVASILLKARDANSETIEHRFRKSMERFAQGEEDGQGRVEQGRKVNVGTHGDHVALWDEQAAAQAAAPAPVDDPAALLRNRLSALCGRADYSNGRAA